jgi:ABC-type multidrug transport system fused ATPase/permease subunit
VFQDSLLFHASIADNIRAGLLAASDTQVQQAARAAGIADWIESLPAGYGTSVSADTCSGGQRQRIAIARALVRDPCLLVLDEPTSALDASTGRAVIETLLQVMQRRTTVLVTHQLRDAIHADQIVVFEQGRVVEAGSHTSLLAAAGSYANLWQQQERRLQARE